MGIIEQLLRGQRTRRNLPDLGFARLDARRVALELHHAVLRLARIALVAPAVGKHDETIAVGRRFFETVPAHHHPQPAMLHRSDEHILYLARIASDTFDEEHAFGVG